MKLKWDLWYRAAKWIGIGAIATAPAWIACAQSIVTTTVQGTVYLAKGTPGSGTLLLSWPAFTTADNQSVAAGRTAITIGQDGTLSAKLAPNLGSTPAGLYYTAVYHMSDGSTSTEYWVVPPGDPVSVAQVRAQLMPAAQAVQAVTKAYVDQAIQSINQGSLTSTGGALTGPLYLNGDPTQPLQAADKRYVDSALTALSAASLAKASAQSFAGPLNAPSLTASVNSQINVMAPPYNAKGDGATDDAVAINAACAAAKAFAPPAVVYFPKVPNFYLVSTLSACTGVSLQGQPGMGNVIGGGGVIIQGKRGQDIVHGADPNTTSLAGLNNNWDISHIQFRVDDSVDASSSFPHRWPGRWVDDASMTSGSAVLTSPHAKFTCSDVGQAVQVKGAGAAGAALMTTIASLPGCDGYQNSATLAASASTTVSNALAYVSVDNISATQTIGNCAFGFDNFDGNSAHWLAGATSWGMSYPTMYDVGIVSVSGGNQNHSCGIFFQGNWTPYGSHFSHLTVARTVFGVVQGMPDTAPGMGIAGQDYQVWDHVLSQATYPWISYNGGDNTLRNWQLGTTYGPVISAVVAYEYEPNNWDIEIQEFEQNSGGIGTILKGKSHHVHNTTLSPGGTVYLEAQGMICNPCTTTGNIVLDADAMNVNITTPHDPFGSSGTSTITDNGVNNTVIGTGNLANPFQGRQPTRPTALNLTRAPGNFGNRSADFLMTGAGATPYLNQQDLFFFPEDYIIQGSPYAIVKDSASFSGKYLKFFTVGGGNVSTYGFASANAAATNQTQLVIGKNVPAAPVIVYDAAKCPTGTYYHFTVMAGSTNVAGADFPCTATYGVNSIVADLSSYVGQNLVLNWWFPGMNELDEAWAGVVPQPNPQLGPSTTATTQAATDNTTKVATTAQVQAAIASYLGAGHGATLADIIGATAWSGYTHRVNIDDAAAGDHIGALWLKDIAFFNSTNGAAVIFGDHNATSNRTILFPDLSGTLAVTSQLPSPILTGTTGSIGGSAVTAGNCASGTATVTGATTSMAVTATPTTYPGDAFDWKAYVSAANTVTVKVCTNLATGGTPTASAYNVRVIP